jgi:hypothetical protein
MTDGSSLSGSTGKNLSWIWWDACSRHAAGDNDPVRAGDP